MTVNYQNAYFNTTQLGGKALFDYEAKAQSQNEIILEFMRHNQRLTLTAEAAAQLLFSEQTPLTSVRRAMTTLYKQGVIEKRDQVQGKYGRLITVWGFKTHQLSLI